MHNEKGKFIMKNQDIANTFNNYFGPIVAKSNFFEWNVKQSGDLISRNIETIIQNFKNHRRCKIIDQHLKKHNTLCRHVTVDEVKKVSVW